MVGARDRWSDEDDRCKTRRLRKTHEEKYRTKANGTERWSVGFMREIWRENEAGGKDD